jgi:hypothetical protein
MATIVCHRTGETKDVGAVQYRVYNVVDGQQRLTTLILLLKSIELKLPEASEDRSDLAKMLVKRDGNLIISLCLSNPAGSWMTDGSSSKLPISAICATSRCRSRSSSAIMSESCFRRLATTRSDSLTAFSAAARACRAAPTPEPSPRVVLRHEDNPSLLKHRAQFEQVQSVLFRSGQG